MLMVGSYICAGGIEKGSFVSKWAINDPKTCINSLENGCLVVQLEMFLRFITYCFSDTKVANYWSGRRCLLISGFLLRKPRAPAV